MNIRSTMKKRDGRGLRARGISGVVCVMAIAAVCLGSCGKKEEAGPREVVREVKMMTVAQPGAEVIANYPGTVRASRRVDLAFKVGGPLIELPVKEGQEVKKGDLIARILPRDFETELARVASDLARARAELKGMEMARPEDIKILEARVEAARARALNARQQYTRYKELYVRKQVSKSDFDKYRSERDIAAAELAKAEQDLHKGKRGARKEDITAMKARIRGLEARRKRAKDALEDTYLKAPFSGLIAKRLVDNYDEVRAGQPIVKLQGIDMVEILVNVPESEMAPVREGSGKMIASAEFSAAPGKKYKLSLKEYSTQADADTQTYQVVLVMPQPKDIHVLPGMTASVIVTAKDGGKEKPVVIIPAVAVMGEPGKGSYVWIYDPKEMTVHKRQVKVGEMTGSKNIEILDGLKGGETIVVGGVTKLQEGMKVKPWKSKEQVPAKTGQKHKEK